jgi:hypothetical protein
MQMSDVKSKDRETVSFVILPRDLIRSDQIDTVLAGSVD